MNVQLLEEIIRFRRMSNLPIVENTPIKLLINEGRGESGVAIWRMVLETGELGAEAVSRRQKAILKMFGDTRSEIAGKNAKISAEETARKNAVLTVEEMVKNGKTTQEIMSFLESKMGTEKWKMANETVEDLVDAEVKKTVIAALTDLNNPITKGIVNDFVDEVTKRMEEIAGDSPLVKKAALDGLKAEFVKTYKKLFGFSEQEGKVVEDLFEKPYKENVASLSSKESKTLTWKQDLMQLFRNFPRVISELSELINLFYLSMAKTEAELIKEIEELVLAIEQGVSKDSGKLIADRIKVLIKNQGDIDGKYMTLYNDLITKIKNAIPDDASGKALLARIEEIEEVTVSKGTDVGTYEKVKAKFKRLEELFADLEVNPTETVGAAFYSFMKKLKELLTPWNLIRKIKTDAAGKVLSSYKGFVYRFINYMVTGTLSTFKEYMEQMSKMRTNYNIFNRKKRTVSGWGSASVIDMYIRVWLRANFWMPIMINIVWGALAAAWTCGTAALASTSDYLEKFGPSDESYNKWCGSPFSNFFRETLSDMGDTFTPFIALIDAVFGSDFDSKLDSPTILSVFWEIFDMVIPFNTRLDDIAYWYTFDPKAKTDKAIEEANKKDEENNVVKPYALEHPKEYAKKMEILTLRKLQVVGLVQNRDNIPKAQELEKIMTIDTLDNKSSDPVFLYKSNLYSLKANPRRKDRPLIVYSQKDGYEFSLDEFISGNMNESRYKKTNNMITERNKEKFGEDNFKHWKDTFTFKSQDEKNPGQYKEVKIKMEDVMDRINHYRKKYDEDDSFVRAVIDTHEDVVKIMFTKDLANIHESATPRGLALVLRTIKESRGEMEIFSVARPANGNWFLVKGDYTPNQLANMDLEKKEPRTKETEVNSKSEDDLKKKEESAINVLKRNEKEGIEDLPKKVRDKVREKMGKGWTTEIPPEELKEYFTTSEINSIFNDKIVIYKLEPTREFFNSLVKFSARIVTKRGFCRTLQSGKNEFELSERQKMTVNHILNKCNTKYESKLGLRNF